jgi:hypothetical protein
MAVGAGAAFLQWDDLSSVHRNATVFFGYGALFVIVFLSYWAKRTFDQVERICDELSMKEAETKESRRLKAEIGAGTPHDFDNDSVLKSYQKPAVGS